MKPSRPDLWLVLLSITVACLLFLGTLAVFLSTGLAGKRTVFRESESNELASAGEGDGEPNPLATPTPPSEQPPEPATESLTIADPPAQLSAGAASSSSNELDALPSSDATHLTEATPSAPQAVFSLHRPPVAPADQSGSASRGEGNAGKVGDDVIRRAFEWKPETKSVVYVIDRSSSMDDDDRFQRVVNCLCDSLDRYQGNRFGVIMFDMGALLPDGTRVDSLDGSDRLRILVRTSKESVQKVKQWVEQVVPGGPGTDPAIAMALALDAKPQLIVLLSDGEFDPATVLQINAYNRGRTHIDCVGLSETVVTLQALAAANGGVYYQAP